jgi:hypothetical protein
MPAGERPEPGREAILRALERHEVLYVVIGGAAAQARGWPERTDDLDVTPERSQGNLARLAAAVEDLAGGFRVDDRRYPDGFRPPGGVDARTFRNQICVAFATATATSTSFFAPTAPEAMRRSSRHRPARGWPAPASWCPSHPLRASCTPRPPQTARRTATPSRACARYSTPSPRVHRTSPGPHAKATTPDAHAQSTTAPIDEQQRRSLCSPGSVGAQASRSSTDSRTLRAQLTAEAAHCNAA